MKSMLSAFVLSGFVAVAPVDQVFANPEQEAIRYAGKALYKEFDLDVYVKRIEQKYLPNEIKVYGGFIGVGVRIITEQRISYTWKF